MVEVLSKLLEQHPKETVEFLRRQQPPGYEGLDVTKLNKCKLTTADLSTAQM